MRKKPLLLENYERFFGTISTGKQLIREFLVKPGENIKACLALNVFDDTCNDDTKASGYYEDCADSEEWMDIENDYRSICEDLVKEIEKYSSYTLTDEDVAIIEDSWYDGSDAYEDVETMIEELPSIYDAQIEAVEMVIANAGE